MREISTTVTVGIGSEIHNHDLEYRDTLEHVHGSPEGVIELIPYRSYKEQINDMVKPYIDRFNEDVERRYQSAWDRYNAGEIKTKPRKRNYKKVDYDYYSEHLNDTYYNRKTNKHEELPMWRSVIIGLGDKEDRQKENITESEAIATFRSVIEKWQEDFPYFRLLGASVHLDEEGFYHCHVDYKPLYENDIGQGLGIGIGNESALAIMGFEPEQSIINGRDKAPLLFNAFRNKIYYRVEEALADANIRLQYGVSKTKEPGKDSSVNQRLENWQATQDAAREIQHQKNVALDVIAGDKVSPEGFLNVKVASDKIKEILTEVEELPRSRFKDNVVVPFRIFDQLKSFMKQLTTTLQHLFHKLDVYEENFKYYDQDHVPVQQYNELADLSEREIQKLREKNNELTFDLKKMQETAVKYKTQSEKKDEFMHQYKINGKPMDEAYRHRERQIKQKEQEL